MRFPCDTNQNASGKRPGVAEPEGPPDACAGKETVVDLPATTSQPGSV